MSKTGNQNLFFHPTWLSKTNMKVTLLLKRVQFLVLSTPRGEQKSEHLEITRPCIFAERGLIFSIVPILCVGSQHTSREMTNMHFGWEGYDFSCSRHHVSSYKTHQHMICERVFLMRGTQFMAPLTLCVEARHPQT